VINETISKLAGFWDRLKLEQKPLYPKFEDWFSGMSRKQENS
jgi:hypothetical protein